MTTAELTKYLKTAAELEASVYRQEEAIRTATEKANSNQYIPKRKHVSSYYDKQLPAKPVATTATEEEVKKGTIVFSLLIVICLGVFATFVIISFTGNRHVNGSVGLGIFLGGILGLLPAALLFRWERKAREEEMQLKMKYQWDLKEYYRIVDEINEENKRGKAEYYRLTEKAEADYNAQSVALTERKTFALTQIDQMKHTLTETKDVLRRLYAINIIFPKYRNMVAMCTIYEYFASGRCSVLTGPNGAYNLYESELRQNIIIAKLDKIISQLEEIKQNQYILYEEMKETRAVLNNISRDVGRIMENTEAIKESSYITAQCAKITAQNTEAIKYISLIN